MQEENLCGPKYRSLFSVVLQPSLISPQAQDQSVFLRSPSSYLCKYLLLLPWWNKVFEQICLFAFKLHLCFSHSLCVNCLGLPQHQKQMQIPHCLLSSARHPKLQGPPPYLLPVLLVLIHIVQNNYSAWYPCVSESKVAGGCLFKIEISIL